MTRFCAAALAMILPWVLVLFPGRVRADINGTPHDLVSQEYDVLKDEKARRVCRPCHPPLGPEGRGLLETIPASLSRYDAATLACFSCHDGTTFVSLEVDATGTAFDPLSHGLAEGDYRKGLSEEAQTAFPDLGGNMMSCVVCHAPHSSDFRPFLRDNFESLCVACHADKVPSGEGGVTTGVNHPLLSDPLEAVVPEMPLETDPGIRVDFPRPYPSVKGKTKEGIHWDLGGHLSEGGSGLLLCVTCHAVHGDEEMRPLENLLSVDPVRERADLLCEGCHRGQRGDPSPSPPYPNPGGTSTARTYHPCDDVAGGLPGQVLPTAAPPGWPFGTVGSRTLLCTTCHTPHQGWKGTAILRIPPTSAAFCEECHTQLPLDYHHPTGAESKGACAAKLPRPVYGTAREGAQCADCHVAHNAGLGEQNEGDYIPILKEPMTSAGYCVSCHSEDDPTCSGTEAGKASHFMGDPTLAETYLDDEPPLRTDPWPESGLKSHYDGDNEQVVGCLSCHAFRPGALISGDDGLSKYLLARAGNPVEWKEGEMDTYLCTGCHSSNPATKGSGHTHPLMTADVTLMPGEVPKPPITATPSGKINCDSCHRSHNAPSNGGYYILELVTSENTDPQAIQPKIDFTEVCHSCHESTKY